MVFAGDISDVIPEVSVATAYMFSLPGDMFYESKVRGDLNNIEIRIFFPYNNVNSKIETGVCEEYNFWKNVASDEGFVIKNVLIKNEPMRRSCVNR